jgi:hypothetical protein
MVGEMLDRVGNVWLVLDQQQPFFTTVVRKELLPCLLNVSELLTPSAPPVFNGVRVTRSVVFCVVFLQFVVCPFVHCIVCPPIYCFWLPLWHLLTFLKNEGLTYVSI